MTKTLASVVAALVLGPSLAFASPQEVASAADPSKTTTSTILAPGDTDTDVKPVDPDNPGGNFTGDPEDPDNPGTGSTGPLTLDYVSNIKFKQDDGLNGRLITATAVNTKAFVQVSDRRYNGHGWKLYVTPSLMIGQKDRSVISAASITLGRSKFTPSYADTVSGKPSVTVDGDQELPLGIPALVARAQKDTGLGTWIMRLNYQPKLLTRLFVNADQVTKSQQYAGEFTWQLTDTP
ncbi:WxL domain-containing protein [Levilactobacillus humaensis]|uniref:WxL domain-containing protein n=1 Tax=Levilactobacillus humaensis TaxID=2950375 RepID=UPI0021C425A2|nr:WxL domain-containing protein [Levilactobacillus humaensis]